MAGDPARRPRRGRLLRHAPRDRVRAAGVRPVPRRGGAGRAGGARRGHLPEGGGRAAAPTPGLPAVVRGDRARGGHRIPALQRARARGGCEHRARRGGDRAAARGHRRRRRAPGGGAAPAPVLGRLRGRRGVGHRVHPHPRGRPPHRGRRAARPRPGRGRRRLHRGRAAGPGDARLAGDLARPGPRRPGDRARDRGARRGHRTTAHGGVARRVRLRRPDLHVPRLLPVVRRAGR